MLKEEKVALTLSNGKSVDAVAPVIVSASRRTDVPAFFADWFFKRLHEGYSAWKNPFNGEKAYVSYQNTRFIVFWSKNPRPLLPHLDELKDLGIGAYVQYTLNDYEDEGLEPSVPALEKRLDTFVRLSENLGRNGVVWRNDPLVLTENMGVDELLRKTERLGDALAGQAERLVFSFADISPTAASNLQRAGVDWQEWTPELMREFTENLARLNEKWGFELATCAEQADFSDCGVVHSHCIDEGLIIRRSSHDAELMKYLGVRFFDDAGTLLPMPRPANAVDLGGGRWAIAGTGLRDKSQRTDCGCIRSKDIGEYSTCRHFCAYCYANKHPDAVLRNAAEMRNQEIQLSFG